MEADPVPEGLEPLGRRGEGVASWSSPSTRRCWWRCQQRRGVPPATDGGVDHPAGWHRGEQLDDALHEHRLVPELRGRLAAGVAHLQPPGELVPAGMSPRNGLDGKRAERGPSIALPGGLQGSDAAPRISVVVLLLSVVWWVGGAVTGRCPSELDPQRGEGVAHVGGVLGAAAVSGPTSASQRSLAQISARSRRAVHDDLARRARRRSRSTWGMTTRPCWSGVTSAAKAMNFRSTVALGLAGLDGGGQPVGDGVEALEGPEAQAAVGHADHPRLAELRTDLGGQDHAALVVQSVLDGSRRSGSAALPWVTNRSARKPLSRAAACHRMPLTLRRSTTSPPPRGRRSPPPCGPPRAPAARPTAAGRPRPRPGGALTGGGGGRRVRRSSRATPTPAATSARSSSGASAAGRAAASERRGVPAAEGGALEPGRGAGAALGDAHDLACRRR